MAKSPAKVQPAAFKASIGILLGLAVILACTRTYIRFRRFRRFFTDDYFLFIATLSLIVGTSLTYVNLPYIYTQVNVEAGKVAPPVDFVQRVLTDEKIQDAATIFLWLTIFAVKFSFLFLFRSLISRLRKMTIWWWCVFAMMIPVWIICECALFISCPVFGPSVIDACVTPQALHRENAILKVSTVLDILTDVMLISIPIILLWRVKIALRKKLALGSILCLSVFLIIISIIKVAAANTIGSQVDTTWGVFWLQAEAAVAVIAVSITMFRSLFLADGSRNGQQHKPSFPQSPTSYKKLWTQRATPQANYPNMPSATFSFGTSTTPRAEAHGSEDIALPVEETDILVTRHFSTQVVREPKNTHPKKNNTISHESFV